MKFIDEEITYVDWLDANDVARLIIKFLCGETYFLKISENDKKLIEKLMKKAKNKGLNYEQFNELLLLLNQDRIGQDFFKYFFGKDIIKLDDIKNGIIKFRGFAMLCFGNFRFAYKHLIRMNETQLKEKLKPYWIEADEIRRKFRKRPPPMLKIEEIRRDKTWYTGEITGPKLLKEADELEKKLKEEKKITRKKELLEFKDQLLQMDVNAKKFQEKALKNTDVYLTWDYMDVYVATSMRHKWEFEETFDLIYEVFSDSRLIKLNLRYFDPTQSKCGNPRDKGLVEGLMLKRVLCTIYMAQESDTMGKDSELAATLAQSTPVIAYVPKYEPNKYATKIADYPLDFFKKRLLILDAEGIFDDPNCIKKLESYDRSFEEIINNFLEEFDKYRSPDSQPFSLWLEKDNREFKKKYSNFFKICQILSIAECYNFDRRADLLKGRHPLSMQVDLQSGVANGVLIVRSAKQCAELLYRLITNTTEFRIKHPKLFNLKEQEVETLYKVNKVFKDKFYFDRNEQTLNLKRDLTDEEISGLGEFARNKYCPKSIRGSLGRFRLEGVTILEEKLSGSPYRVVTDNEKLTNSFWNLFTYIR